MFKRIFLLFCCIVLLISVMTQSASATNIKNRALGGGQEITPMWSNVLAITCQMSDQNGKLGLYVTLDGYPGTVFTDISISVYKQSGTDIGLIERWVGITCNDNWYSFSQYIPAVLDGEFKVGVRVTALNNGYSETITRYYYRTF